MSRNFKFLLTSFFLSLPFWWGMNVLEEDLENFLYWKKIADNPQLLTAQIVQEEILENLKPIRNREIENPEITAKAVISVFIAENGTKKILFEKNSNQKLPIASLTKLMTANIVLETIEPKEDFGQSKAGEIFSVENLLYPLLIESSNDSAIALTQVIGEKAFVDLMNLEAKNLGMENTYFVNSTGLDPDEPEGPINYSTAEDLTNLAIYLLETKPKILEISALPEFDLPSATGSPRKIKNTNDLLTEIPLIVGGKTGETPKAGGCLLLVLESPKGKGYLINVILGSDDRFGEMKKLVAWLNLAYKW